MNDSFTTEFAGLPTEIKPKQNPSTMGELGTRWNQVFGTDEVSKKVEKLTPVTQAEMLGLVSAGAVYWEEIKDNSEMFRPFWTKENPVEESEWWQKAAECLELGEGDFESINHLTKFFTDQINGDNKSNNSETPRKRLAEVVVWLTDFQKNPRPLPKWQEVKMGTPTIKYREV